MMAKILLWLLVHIKIFFTDKIIINFLDIASKEEGSIMEIGSLLVILQAKLQESMEDSKTYTKLI
jgi:hypothetical protein